MTISGLGDRLSRHNPPHLLPLLPHLTPLLPARAAGHLSEDSRLRIRLLGAALEPELGREAERCSASSAHFEWLGDVPRATALARLAGADLALFCSHGEGGPNALTEALALGVPVLASDVSHQTGHRRAYAALR